MEGYALELIGAGLMIAAAVLYSERPRLFNTLRSLFLRLIVPIGLIAYGDYLQDMGRIDDGSWFGFAGFLWLPVGVFWPYEDGR